MLWREQKAGFGINGGFELMFEECVLRYFFLLYLFIWLHFSPFYVGCSFLSFLSLNDFGFYHHFSILKDYVDPAVAWCSTCTKFMVL